MDSYIPEETIETHPNRELYRMWVDGGWLKVCPGAVIDMDMIINRRSMIFTGFAARLRCFRDMHWETGGADIMNIHRNLTKR